MSKKSHTAIVSSVETALKDTSAPVAPLVEMVSEQERIELDSVKRQMNEARDKAHLSALQVQNAELTYNNTVLRFALKYRLVDGDLISETGEIVRKGK